MMLLVLPLSFAQQHVRPDRDDAGLAADRRRRQPADAPDRRRAGPARRRADGRRTCCGRSPGWPACWPSSCRSPYGRTVAASEPAGTSRARAASRSAPRPRAYAASNAVVAERLAQVGGDRGDLEVRPVRRTAQAGGRAEHLRGVARVGPARAASSPPRRPSSPRSACRATRSRRRRRRRSPRPRRRCRRRPVRRSRCSSAPWRARARARGGRRSLRPAAATRSIAQVARSRRGRRAPTAAGSATRRRRPTPRG